MYNGNEIFSLPIVSVPEVTKSLKAPKSSTAKKARKRKPYEKKDNEEETDEDDESQRKPNNDWRGQLLKLQGKYDVMKEQLQKKEEQLKTIDDKHQKEIDKLETTIADLKKEVKEERAKYEKKSQQMEDMLTKRTDKQDSQLDQKDIRLVNQYESSIQQANVNKDQWRVLAKKSIQERQQMTFGVMAAIQSINASKIKTQNFHAIMSKWTNEKQEYEQKNKITVSNQEFYDKVKTDCVSEMRNIQSRKLLLEEQIPILEKKLQESISLSSSSSSSSSSSYSVIEPEEQSLLNDAKILQSKIEELKLEKADLNQKGLDLQTRNQQLVIYSTSSTSGKS
jgi:hypothetical protein